MEDQRESIRYYMRKTMIDKYGKYAIQSEAGGLFGAKARKKLLGFNTISPREKNEFWHKRREDVKMGLKDLVMFLGMAPDEHVRQVLTDKMEKTAGLMNNKESELTFRPLVETILRLPISGVAPDEPDLVKARIAQMFIERGFEYLGSMKREYVTEAHMRTIHEAVDLSKFLVEAFRPDAFRQKRYTGREASQWS